MQVTPLRYHDDNYCYFVKHNNDESYSVVDPGDSKMILGFIKKNELKIRQIIITHKHWDHTGDIEWFHESLSKYMGAKVDLFAGNFFFCEILNFQAQQIKFQGPPIQCALETKKRRLISRISIC